MDNINKVVDGKVLIEDSDKKFEMRFLIPKAKLVVTELRQACNIAPILHQLDPKYHIQIKNNASGYTIDKIFS